MKLCQLAEEKQLTDEQFRYFTKGWQALWGMIIDLSSADRPQGEAIPIEWIDKHLEWLDNCDNEFAQLAAASIREMVMIWHSEQLLDKLTERSRR